MLAIAAHRIVPSPLFVAVYREARRPAVLSAAGIRPPALTLRGVHLLQYSTSAHTRTLYKLSSVYLMP